MLWWKIYFWIFSLLTSIGLISLLFSINKFTLIDWLSVILNILLVVCIYSYVFKKELLSQQNWKVIFLVNAIFWGINFIYELLLPENLKASLSILASGFELDKVTTVFAFVMVLPAIYTLYKLAYKK